MKKLMIVSDLHVPNHDEAAYGLILKVLKTWQPDIFVINGDFIDCEAVSQHDKEFGRSYNFQSELDQAVAMLKELEALTERRIFIEGNHERRWPRYLMKNAPSDNRRANEIPALLALGQQWQHVAYRDFARVGKLYITHDLEKSGKYALHQAVADAQHNVVIGHTHRMGSVYEGSSTGDSHLARSFGWLGDIDTITYKHKIRARREWQLGFGVGYLDKNGNIFLQDAPIVSGTCVIDGKLYRNG